MNYDRIGQVHKEIIKKEQGRRDRRSSITIDGNGAGGRARHHGHYGVDECY